MKKRYLLVLLFGVFLNSCIENLDPENTRETIYVDHDKSTMSVYLHGNAASKIIILVIHGGPGGNGLEYRYGSFNDVLEEKYLMAYWDQRGQGMAQGKLSEGDFTLAKMTADLNAVVLTLKKKYGDDTSIVLMGHSWGGTLGTSYMINPAYQKNVSAWIEVDGAHDMPLNDKTAVEKFRQESAFQLSLGNSVSDWEAIQSWAQNLDINNIPDTTSYEINSKAFEVENYLTNDGFINPYESELSDLKLALFSPMNAITAYLSGNSTNGLLADEVFTLNFTGQLHKIQKPCLLLWGKYDFVVPMALGESAIQRIGSSNKKLIIFDKSGHSPMSNEPEKFSQSVIDFIDGL